MRGKQLPETFREGEFIESLEGLIFDVKGLVHPKDRVVAFVRYIPDPQGSRMRGTVAYRKVYEFSERYSYLQRAWPEYLVHDPVFDEEIIEVPRDRISKHYKPLEKTRELLTKPRTNLEKKTTEMITALASASQIPKEDLGVSGSILVGLAGPESDIDIVVYGSKRCRRVRLALKSLFGEERDFRSYGEEKIRTLYESRHRETGVAFADYFRCESRKDFQGRFRGTDFFVRYVKDFSEADEEYGSVHYKALAYGSVEAMVVDDEEAMNMVGHGNKRIQFDVTKMARESIPAGDNNFPFPRQRHFALTIYLPK